MALPASFKVYKFSFYFPEYYLTLVGSLTHQIAIMFFPVLAQSFRSYIDLPVVERTEQAKLCMIKTLEIFSLLLSGLDSKNIEAFRTVPRPTMAAYMSSISGLSKIFQNYEKQVIYPESWVHSNLIDGGSPYYSQPYARIARVSLSLYESLPTLPERQ